jgi:hypothetical protein
LIPLGTWLVLVPSASGRRRRRRRELEPFASVLAEVYSSSPLALNLSL